MVCFAESQEPMSYDQFRCGLTFGEVYWGLREEADRRWQMGERMFISRRTVLGRMRQIKLGSYEAYTRWIGSES